MPAPARVRKRTPRYMEDDEDASDTRRVRQSYGMSASNLRPDTDDDINNGNDDDSTTTNPNRTNNNINNTTTTNNNNNNNINITSPRQQEDHGEEYPDDGIDEDDNEEDDVEVVADDATPRHGTQSTPLQQRNTATRTPQTLPPQLPTPATTPTNAVGLEAAILRIYPHGVPDEISNAELQWQSEVKGDVQATKAFRSEVLMQQGLVVFAFMQPDDTTMSILHSPASYMARGAEGALKGKDIGFVGDRLPFTNPVPVILQKEKPWKWITVLAELDEVAISGFYANPANANKFYTPPPTAALSNIKLPRLILIPSNLVAYCVAKPRTPGELLMEIVCELGRNPNLNSATYDLIMNWCMAASQATDTSSLITYSLDAAHSNTTTYSNWVSLRLTATLGQQFTNTAQPTQPPPTANSNTAALATLAAEFGKGVLQALQPPGAATGATAIGAIQGTTTTAGKSYDAYQYAVIQGFSNCPTQAGLQPLWGLFTQTKNVDTIRLHIKTSMRRWATRYCVNIHNGLHLSTPTIEAIRNVLFNPGGGVAYFSSAEKGISILTCQPEPGEKRELVRATEIAQENSTTNRTLAEALELGKHDPRAPPGTYQDLKATVGTFCGLLHTIFGPGCDYYLKCFELYACLNSDTVEENAHHFDPLYCRQIIWAILDSGREYFNKPMLPDAFLVPVGTRIDYPISELDEFTRLIKNQTPIIKKNFPHQWQPKQERSETRTRNQSGTGGQNRPTIPSVISGAASTASARTGASSLTGTTATAPTTIRQSNIHPKFKNAIGKYVARVGRLQISRIMALAGVTWADMPTLPAYMDGTTSKLCYNYILGKCNPRYCNHRYGHAPESDITDEFADKVCALLQPGLDDMTQELAKCSWPEFKANVDSRNRSSE